MSKKKKPSKKAVKKVAKKIATNKKKTSRVVSTRKKPLQPNRYNAIQKILADYCKENNIKLGSNFTKIASRLNQHTKGSPLKYVEQNIAEIYKEHFAKAPIPSTFPDKIPFYQFGSDLLSPVFFGAVVSFKFDDGIEKFETKGTAEEVEEYFKIDAFRYLRKNYNDSPPAEFVISKTDNKTFVEYKLETYSAPKVAEPEKLAEKPATTTLTDTGAVKFTAKEIIAIEKEKQRTTLYQLFADKKVTKKFFEQEIKRINKK